MPTYPSSLLLGSAPGTRHVDNYTSRFEFRYDVTPNAASIAGIALSAGTATTLPSSPSYSNGVLTGSGSTTFLVDGVFYTSTSTTVLVKDQASAIQNGVYYLSKAGSASTYWQLTRDTRFDEDAEIKRNEIFTIASGTANASTKWYLSSNEPMVIGTDSINFTAIGSTVVYPSAAHYSTDVNVGTGNITNATMFIQDFRSLINTLQYDLAAIETSFASVSTEGLKWMAASNGYSLQSIYRRLKKVDLQITKLKDDMNRMNTVGFSATYPGIGLTSSYPSGKNRLTNTAGGY
jgi:hypothetical protein